GDVLMWLMKTLLTSGCTNQRGAGQNISTRSNFVNQLRFIHCSLPLFIIYIAPESFTARPRSSYISPAMTLQHPLLMANPISNLN
ncbi:hypothetical protein VBJ82_18365, partial [Enterobacter hormaechei]|nr:hypothetical protein [Enterobacter hormaechei]